MKILVTFENFVRFTTIFNCGSKYLVVMVMSLSTFGVFASDLETNVIVGEVSLVLGKAYIDGPERSRQSVEVGSPIMVNDLVVTEANGHVHIRFVDQALVSVRPGSRLEIVRYSYNPAQPEQSSVKFNLVEGVTRAISGDAAKSARDRFRLNTPIAAIGVRGTDFVVSASQESVRALVNEGTIVMAPYSDTCTVDTFGPCAVNAVELTGESLQILEINAEAPTTLPASVERDPSIMREETQLAVSDTSSTAETEQVDQSLSDSVYQESVTSVEVTARAEEVAAAESVVIVPEPEPEPLPDFTPNEALSYEVLNERQLMWGRWLWSVGQGDLERITVSSTLATQDRDVTVGSGDYALYRLDEKRQGGVDLGLGVVGFALNSAQAFYNSDSGVVAMQVNGGSLDIDFNENTFATELNLNHLSTGAIDFTAMGNIYSGGFFYDRSASQNVLGAVSIDGQEAGYYFDRQLENGGIQGLTLWDAQ